MKFLWTKLYDHEAAKAKLFNALRAEPKDLLGVIPSHPNVQIVARAKEKRMSFLSAFGKDFKAVFAWLGSAKGQAVVSGAEGLTETVATAFGAGAPVAAALRLINTWGTEIIKTEALAAAAGSQTGSGELKAAAVLTAIEPDIQVAAANGLPAPSAANLAIINTALVTVLNALGAPVASPVPPAVPVA